MQRRSSYSAKSVITACVAVLIYKLLQSCETKKREKRAKDKEVETRILILVYSLVMDLHYRNPLLNLGLGGGGKSEVSNLPSFPNFGPFFKLFVF